MSPSNDERTVEDRVAMATATLTPYLQGGASEAEALTDALTDLMHLAARRLPGRWAAQLGLARMHYLVEGGSDTVAVGPTDPGYEDEDHFCSGCGRCQDSGCDGGHNLHTSDCPFTCCRNCNAEEEECTCGHYEDGEGQDYCTYCGAYVGGEHKSRCGRPAGQLKVDQRTPRAL
jgi:hypothetical protein